MIKQWKFYVIVIIIGFITFAYFNQPKFGREFKVKRNVAKMTNVLADFARSKKPVKSLSLKEREKIFDYATKLAEYAGVYADTSMTTLEKANRLANLIYRAKKPNRTFFDYCTGGILPEITEITTHQKYVYTTKDGTKVNAKLYKPEKRLLPGKEFSVLFMDFEPNKKNQTDYLVLSALDDPRYESIPYVQFLYNYRAKKRFEEECKFLVVHYCLNGRIKYYKRCTIKEMDENKGKTNFTEDEKRKKLNFHIEQGLKVYYDIYNKIAKKMKIDK